MNNTSPEAFITCDNNNQFSRANAFGMFLTLQLCQLTQPSGSLLFLGVSSFYWRCNPIASLVEACIIVWHLAESLLLSSKPDAPPMLKILQSSATGLLLLRANTPAYVKRLAKTVEGMRTDGETLLARQRSTSNELSRTQQPMKSNSNSSSLPGGDSDSGTAMNEGTAASLIWQQTLDEENQTLSRINPHAEKSYELKEALGSNALAHREWAIDIVTATAEILIFLKLIAINNGSWIFTTCCIFLIAGWMSIQLLLVLLHSREMNQLDMKNAAKASKRLQERLEDQSWCWILLYIACHVPFFGYASYFFAITPWFPATTSGYMRYIKNSCCYMELAFFSCICTFSFFFFLASLFWSRKRGLHRLVWVLLGGPLGFWLFMSSCYGLVAVFKCFEVSDDVKAQMEDLPAWTKIFFPNQFPFLVWFSIALFCFIILFYHLFIPPTTRLDDLLAISAREEFGLDMKRISIGNAGFILVVFVIFITSYDPRGTFKPSWTEWLG
jgi:hypothetical protein